MTEALRALWSDEAIAGTLAACNVNPQTGFVTNYLNHYVEILLLLEALPEMPECADDLSAWQPETYRNHVRDSGLNNTDLVLEAFEVSDETMRAALDAVCAKLNAALASLKGDALNAAERNDVASLRETSARAKETLSPLIGELNSVLTAGHADPVNS